MEEVSEKCTLNAYIGVLRMFTSNTSADVSGLCRSLSFSVKVKA